MIRTRSVVQANALNVTPFAQILMKRHSEANICIETKRVTERGLPCEWCCQPSSKFKNLMVTCRWRKMTQYAAQPARGGVAVEQLSLIQCYINFPIYAALVKIWSPGAFWGARVTFVVDACSHPDAQRLLFILYFYIHVWGCLSFVSYLSQVRFSTVSQRAFFSRWCYWGGGKFHCKFYVVFFSTAADQLLSILSRN